MAASDCSMPIRGRSSPRCQPERAGSRDLAFSPDGKSILTGDHNTTVQPWSLDERRSLDLAPDSPPHHAPEAGGPDRADRRRRSPGRRPLGRHDLLLEEARGASDRPTGSTPAARPGRRFPRIAGSSCRGGPASARGTLLATRVYDASTGSSAGPTLDPGGIVIDARFHPDGARVAIASLVARDAQGSPGTPLPARRQVGERPGLGLEVGGNASSGPSPCRPSPAAWRSAPAARPWRWSALIIAWSSSISAPARSGSTSTPGFGPGPFNANLWSTNGEALFSPDGKYLLTWERVPTLHVWDPRRRPARADLGTHRARRPIGLQPGVCRTSWRPAAGTARRRSGTSMRGALVATLQHPRWVVDVHFSPDGYELISGCKRRPDPLLGLADRGR